MGLVLERQEEGSPECGLKRSLPYRADLILVSVGAMAVSRAAYLNDMPYWATLSKPDFQTRVTSQAFVACRRQERKAETALPPTASLSAMMGRVQRVRTGEDAQARNSGSHGVVGAVSVALAGGGAKKVGVAADAADSTRTGL